MNLYIVIILNVTIIITNFLYTASAYGSKMGPYDIVFRHFDECPEAGTKEIRMFFKVRKYNRTVTILDANMTLLTDIDDDVTMSVDLAQFTNGGYKDKFFFKEFPRVCKTWYSYSAFVKDVYRAAKIGKCPIKKGVYTLTNYTTQADVEFLPVFFYNKYRGVISFFKKNKLVGCFQSFAEFVPKKKISG